MKTLLRNTALVFVSLAVAGLLAEVALRLIGFEYPSFYVHDRFTGNALRPAAQGWWRDEGESFVRINAAGMRDDREPAKEKPLGVFRIAVLGDSYAEALQVPVEQTFWRRLESRLQVCNFAAGKRIEVLNFGVSGYSTAQELLALRRRALTYGPDLVLLAFVSGNDVRDNSREIAGPYPRPYFDAKPDGTLVPDFSFRDSRVFQIKSSAAWRLMRQFSDRSRLIQLVNKSANIAGQPFSAPRSQAPIGEIGLDEHIYLSRPPDVWERAWQLTERLIAEVRAESVQAGARFFFVTLTNPGQVSPDQGRMQAQAHRLGELDLFYPERRLRRFVQREQIESVFLAEQFADYAAAHRVHLHGFANTQLGGGHWNENGHTLAAELIARYLCQHPSN